MNKNIIAEKPKKRFSELMSLLIFLCHFKPTLVLFESEMETFQFAWGLLFPPLKHDLPLWVSQSIFCVVSLVEAEKVGSEGMEAHSLMTVKVCLWFLRLSQTWFGFKESVAAAFGSHITWNHWLASRLLIVVVPSVGAPQRFYQFHCFYKNSGDNLLHAR